MNYSLVMNIIEGGGNIFQVTAGFGWRKRRAADTGAQCASFHKGHNNVVPGNVTYLTLTGIVYLYEVFIM